MKPASTELLPLDDLRGVPYTILRFECETATGLAYHPWAGSRIRGAIGCALRIECCYSPGSKCESCRYKKDCVFAVGFLGIPAERPEAYGSLATPPSPIVLRPPPPCDFPAGSIIGFELVLLGSALRYAADITGAAIFAGERGTGRFGGVFRVTNIYESSSGTLAEIAEGCHESALPTPCRMVTLHMYTPVRIKKHGAIRDGSAPPFIDLVDQVLRRLALITAFHSSVVLDLDTTSIRKLAESVMIAEDATIRHEGISVSRQRRSRYVDYPGRLGSVTYSGNITPLLPLLYLGEILNIGKGSTIGFGRYAVHRGGGH